ncbi:MAG: hypothetical protein MSIBF_01910 [Candidatus Altiarchaeales archaeon IMC4]|nr:MAG: hypothetical protein MSIBF_01910 [Candidatus Altiarchaeales archaeon IMC4]
MSEKAVIEKTFNEDLHVDDEVSQGKILCQIYLKVESDEDALENAVDSIVVEPFTMDSNIDLLEVKVHEIEKGDKFLGVVETKMLVRDFRTLAAVVMGYGPVAVRIVKPERINITIDQLHSMLVEISEMSQNLSNQITSMLTDTERRKMYSGLKK